MNQPIILGLLQNTAILLAFGMLYDYFWAREEPSKTIWHKVVAGLVIGAIGIILILTPWTLVPGLVFDTRSVMLSVSGLFFGPIPTLIAMVITSGYRIFLGGDGMWMGVAVIITSGFIGILWRKWRPDWRRKNYLVELLTLGLVVHVVMLGCTLLLPPGVSWPTLKIIALPVIIIYPAGTLLLGILMIKRSEHWETRKALQQSEERWHFALEGAGDGVWDWNPKTGTVFYSHRWKEMLGFDDDEIQNSIEEWDILVHPDDRDTVYADLNRHMAGETPVYMNIHRLRCKDGTFLWILDRGKVMEWDDQGQPVRFIGTHTNINDRKMAEEELILAKSKAEESDRLKMSFLNNISHEVRTPLNAILGFTSLLTEDPGMEDRHRFGQIIRSNADQLLSIIDDVLEFSRLETETLVPEKLPFSVSELLQDLAHTMQPLAEEKNLSWRHLSTLDEEMDIILGDRSRIRQVLTCFLSNAIKYTQDGGVETRVETDDKWIIFSVRDTGIGIEEEHQEKIFERFFRTPVAQEMAVRGTGLGLSIAQQLIEMMGGGIGIQPLLPRGTEFYFRLPLVSTGNSRLAQKDVLASMDLSALHLLVAEDEEDNFEFLKVLLGKKVMKMTHAVNGKEVLEILNHSTPDLILMDLKMPVMDGYEAAREIRKSGITIPIIALTAYSQPEEKKLAAEAGCSLFISKPISKKVLFEAIGNVLAG
ncbi:MAG: response regulator [Bacteroidales bacterium]|nr:response regulator [Bacteroidales bacterium]